MRVNLSLVQDSFRVYNKWQELEILKKVAQTYELESRSTCVAIQPASMIDLYSLGLLNTCTKDNYSLFTDAPIGSDKFRTICYSGSPLSVVWPIFRAPTITWFGLLRGEVHLPSGVPQRVGFDFDGVFVHDAETATKWQWFILDQFILVPYRPNYFILTGRPDLGGVIYDLGRFGMSWPREQMFCRPANVGDSPRDIALWKADMINKLNLGLFVESNDYQAEIISHHVCWYVASITGGTIRKGLKQYGEGINQRY